MDAQDLDVAAHVDRVQSSDGGISGKSPHASTQTSETGGNEKFLSKRSPDVVEIACDDDGGSVMKADEGVAREKFSELQPALDAR